MIDDASDPHAHTIALSVPEAELALIDRAASLRGQSRADFMRKAAARAAQSDMPEQRVFPLSEDSFAGFLDVLAQPGKVIPGFAELLRRTAPWDTRDDESPLA